MTRKVFRWAFAPLAITFFIVSAAVRVGSGQQQTGGPVGGACQVTVTMAGEDTPDALRA